ncbi:hypothetical protein GM3708_323 [Geminocystis sp. NIES-3708]|uniref:hypothetical protein n=1 Tax=Geminocystis sp. NIES-3708 TaxID=1615909 RepID=UPI0005FCCC69|nr:hypothetical protein [Geminocystis sp. NIES-3708]BAQ59917.1 hypothetical protein GM3708_323 [Geminocystis sp. NIES-3708]
MNQSTQFLSPQFSRFWLHFCLGFTSFFSYALITSSIGQDAIAFAGIEIMVDPYNDSNFEPLSIEAPSIKTNPSANNKALPTTNQNYGIGEILINGNPTPKPPTFSSGNLIKSNQTLPQIPLLSEPYRKPNTNDEINQNSTDEEITEKTNATQLSVSVSPFDETPKENQPSLSSEKSVKPVSNLSINLSPNASPSNNNTSINTEQNINTLSSPSVLGKRRSLNDILVFSTPPENNSNNSTVNSKTPVNQELLLTTKTNIHKILVKVNNETQESQVRSLYPEAFRTNLKGESMLQVGVFSNSETAQEISNSLQKMGLKTLTINH